MIFSNRSIEYADLLVPMRKCPLGETVTDCPFIEYWEHKDEVERNNILEKLSEEKLDELREFHRRCLTKKIEKAQKNTALQYKKQKMRDF